jgi:ubiquinone/menaquinone biosynthesis C-methylase UbiE
MSITERIGAQFRKPTGFGGLLSTFLMNTLNRRQYSAVERTLALTDGKRILDVGFGNGFMLGRLSKRYSCEYYGIEISEDMLTSATRRNERFVKNGIMKLTLDDVMKTDFADGFFDKVYSINTVYFWDDLSAGLSEIYRILGNGGVFVNAIYSREWLDKMSYTRTGFAKYSIDELVLAGEKCGFSVQVVPIARGKSYCLIYAR